MREPKVSYATAKVQIHRRFWRAMKTLAALKELRIIGARQYRAFVNRLKAEHVRWKTKEMSGYPRRRGRPPKPKKKRLVCKRPGCNRLVKIDGQAYCSPRCAPLSRYFYGD